MPELVEQRFNFTVRQQRGLPANGRVHVGTDEAQVGIWTNGHDKAVHPRPGPFVLSRVKVNVERSQMRAVPLDELVGAHTAVPHGQIGIRLDDDSVQTFDSLEETIEHRLHREVWAELFFVEVVDGGSLLLRVVGDIPWVHRRFISGELVMERHQFLVFPLEKVEGFLPNITHELAGHGS